ncbi:hypothetical protein [Nocardia brasiliensis]|uniref:hypothetical protein n=1 Tax=Nocardia brasiliensis TaxID=37326 RepID=UPI00366CF9A2
MLGQARDAASYSTMLRESIGRVAAFRSGHLALLELRLEATRRPELRALLTERVRADIDENVIRHEAAGLPGGATGRSILRSAPRSRVEGRPRVPRAHEVLQVGRVLVSSAG